MKRRKTMSKEHMLICNQRIRPIWHTSLGG